MHRLNGSVQVSSPVQGLYAAQCETQCGTQCGTQFRLLWPDTLAVEDLLLLRAGSQQWAVLAADIEATHPVTDNTSAVPHLAHILEHEAVQTVADEQAATVLLGQQNSVWQVNQILGRREAIVERDLPFLQHLPWAEGAIISDTGEPIIVLRLHALPLPQAAAPPQSAPVVMLVDDSITMRTFTTRVLQRQGYSVRLAKDGRDALTQLRTQQALPALLIIDLEMPHMDGIQLLEAMRARPSLQSLPVIVVSARNSQRHRQRVAELGVEHFLAKPYREEDLLRLVQRQLQHQVTEEGQA